MDAVIFLIVVGIALYLVILLFFVLGIRVRGRRASKGYIVNSSKPKTILYAPDLAQNHDGAIFYIEETLPLTNKSPHQYLAFLRSISGKGGTFPWSYNEGDLMSPTAEETIGSNAITLCTKQGLVYKAQLSAELKQLGKQTELIEELRKERQGKKDLETNIEKKADHIVELLNKVESSTSKPARVVTTQT